MKTIAIIGAGGFAREVEWLISELNSVHDRYIFKGFIVSDLSKVGEHDSKPLGDYSWLESNPVDCLAIGIGTPSVRLRIAEELKARFPHIQWPALIHDSLIYHEETCKIGEGSIVCAGNIFTVNVTVEPFALINLSCTIGHEAVIGAGSVLNPSVNISGGVRIGKSCLIGTGAQVLQYVSVGDGATVGAGAVVAKPVEPGVTVVGIPAKPR